MLTSLQNSPSLRQFLKTFKTQIGQQTFPEGNTANEAMIDPATEVKKPARLPSATHHVIVKLETIHVPPPEVNDGDLGAGVTHEVIGYEYTRPSESAVAAARALPASVLITTTVPINKETLGEAPYL